VVDSALAPLARTRLVLARIGSRPEREATKSRPRSRGVIVRATRCSDIVVVERIQNTNTKRICNAPISL